MEINLSEDEALVLFEWLANLDGSPLEADIEAPERYALLRLEGQLQSVLVAPFRPDYGKLIEDARARLRGLAGE